MLLHEAKERESYMQRGSAKSLAACCFNNFYRSKRACTLYFLDLFLTAKLTAKPADNSIFRWIPMDIQSACGAEGGRWWTPKKGEMPMERFEPSTLAGLVFETSAYTVPPHRLIRPA